MVSTATSATNRSLSNARTRAKAREEKSEAVGELKYTMDFKPSQSHPYALREIRLSSHFAQKAIRRAYERAMAALYTMSVTLRMIATNREIAVLAEKRATQRIDDVYQELDAEIDRLIAVRDHARSAAGNISFQGHTKPRVFQVPFYTPLTLRYIALIEKLDEVVCIIDEVCVLGGLDEGQRINLGNKWTGRVQHLALTLDRLQVNARRSIYRTRQQEEAKREHEKVFEEIKLDSTRSETDVSFVAEHDDTAAELDEGLDEQGEDQDLEPLDSGLAKVEDVTDKKPAAHAAG